MTGPSRLAAELRRRHELGGGDRGTSLMELVVGMSIMAIFMGMFTAAVIMLYQSTDKAQAVNASTGQLNQAFLTLDRTVRYAAAISTPAVGATGGTGDWYVELRTTTTGSEVCTQLRVDISSSQLQRRSWTVTSGVAGTPSAWVPLASGVTNGAAAAGSTDQPFVLKTPSGSVRVQQLAFRLLTTSGANKAATTSTSAFSFSALNSSLPAPTGVCTFSGWRP